MDIVKLFETNSTTEHKNNIDTVLAMNGGIDPLDGVLLYLQATTIKQGQHIVEFSPNAGYSSLCIALGLKFAGIKNVFYSFEINTAMKPVLNALIDRHNLQEYVQFVYGDAIQEVPKYIDLKYLNVTLCFIDSDHRAEFAEKYIQSIFPRLSKNCQVIIHDIAGEKSGDGKNASFKTSLLSDGSYKSGEEKPIKDWLTNSNIKHFVLHALTGGRHEAANLPVNNTLYNYIKSVWNVDFRNSRMCPKTLWFKLNNE